MNDHRTTRLLTTATLRVLALTAIVDGASAQPAPPPPPPPPPPPVAVPAPAPPAGAPEALPPAPAATPAPPPAVVDTATAPISLHEAIRTTLRSHPGLLRAKAELAARTASVGLARAPFDPVLVAGLSHNHDERPVLPGQRFVPQQSSFVTDTTSFSVGASALTTWGMTIAPSVGLQRIHARPGGSVAVPGLATDPTQQALVGLTLVQSLLRGAGWTGAASGIDAARAARRASEHALAFTAQQLAFETATAYFTLVAAREQLSLFKEAEANATKLVNDTRILVEENQRPRADLRQIEGNLANRARAVIQARNDEIQALYRLRAAMGLSVQELTPWAPADPMPAARIPAADRVAAVKRARQTRQDLKVAREFVESARAALRGAEWNTKPALDLSATIGYAGANDRDGVDAFFASAGNNVPGVNALVGLSLELPVNNTLRNSERDLRRSELEQARVAVVDLERNVPINVLSALDDLALSAESLEAANRTTEYYRQAVADEQEKLSEGVGTVIDTILSQELLIQARQNQVLNHLRYAAARARLVFETGELPIDESGVDRAVRVLLDQGGGSAR